jgi:hypothetical protein
MLYGILKSSVNTGDDSELQCVFSTPLQVNSNQPAYVQDMMNLKRRASSQKAQRWEIEANLSPTNDDASYLVHSVANGHNEIFYVRMPQVANLPIWRGTVKNSADLKVGATEMAYTFIPDPYYTHPVGFVQKPGEFFQFWNHTKVYLNTGIKDGKLQFSPPLHMDVTAMKAITRGGSVTMKARYDASTKLGITYTDGILSDPGSVKLVEALE